MQECYLHRRRTSVRLSKFVTSAAALFLATLAASAQTWQPGKTLHIGGEGAWDYVTVDAATHRIFLTRTTHTQVLDESGKVLGDIPGQVRSHGVAIAPSANRGFITDGGGSGAILIFDLTTYATIGKLAAIPDADGILYDAALNRVFVASGDGNALLTFKADISPTGKIDAPIALGGAPEFLASDGSGKIYVNLQDKDIVAVVDVATRNVVARWPVAPGGSPVGLSIDPVAHHLFVGCRKPQKLVVMSTVDGKVLASLPIGAGVDATAFANGQAFASTRDGQLTVISTKAGKFEIAQTVPTAVGARTLGVDAVAGKIFLPTADFEAAVGNTRPKPKADTFRLVEVDRAK
jgi:YVTN family beta-propeller protein